MRLTRQLEKPPEGTVVEGGTVTYSDEGLLGDNLSDAPQTRPSLPTMSLSTLPTSRNLLGDANYE